MWYKIEFPERRPQEREFNLRNCTKCENCEICNSLKTTKSNCESCSDCFPDPSYEYPLSIMPCDKCEKCENDLRFVDCAICHNCESCELNMEIMKPPRLKGHTTVVADQGLLLYGGITWPDVQMSVSDVVRKRSEEFDELCNDIIIELVAKEQRINWKLPTLSSRDIGTKWWKYMWLRTRHTCFDIRLYPAFPEDTRKISYAKDMYILPLDNCWEDCNGNGGCTTGRCTCKNGYHGAACEYLNCPNSLIFVDIDTLNAQM